VESAGTLLQEVVGEDRTQKVTRAAQAGDGGLDPRQFICVTLVAGGREALREVTSELQHELSTLSFRKSASHSRRVIEIVVPQA
jgi:hypothetical protein